MCRSLPVFRSLSQSLIPIARVQRKSRFTFDRFLIRLDSYDSFRNLQRSPRLVLLQIEANYLLEWLVLNKAKRLRDLLFLRRYQCSGEAVQSSGGICLFEDCMEAAQVLI